MKQKVTMADTVSQTDKLFMEQVLFYCFSFAKTDISLL